MENRQKDFQRFCEAVKTDEDGLLRNWNSSYPHIIQNIGLMILGFKENKFNEVCIVSYRNIFTWLVIIKVSFSFFEMTWYVSVTVLVYLFFRYLKNKNKI